MNFGQEIKGRSMDTGDFFTQVVVHGNGLMAQTSLISSIMYESSTMSPSAAKPMNQ